VTSSVSYSKLSALALEFRNANQTATTTNSTTSVTITYEDGDGDEITICTDVELTDAFLQYVKTDPPILRVKAYFDGPSIPFKVKKTIGQATDLAKKFVKNAMDGVSPRKKNKDSEEQVELDPNFIHGRHTCDECKVTPIIGLRYSALKLPNYNLCEKCILISGEKDQFEPVELERDRQLQTKWKIRSQWRQDSERCLQPEEAVTEVENIDRQRCLQPEEAVAGVGNINWGALRQWKQERQQSLQPEEAVTKERCLIEEEDDGLVDVKAKEGTRQEESFTFIENVDLESVSVLSVQQEKEKEKGVKRTSIEDYDAAKSLSDFQVITGLFQH